MHKRHRLDTTYNRGAIEVGEGVPQELRRKVTRAWQAEQLIDIPSHVQQLPTTPRSAKRHGQGTANAVVWTSLIVSPSKRDGKSPLARWWHAPKQQLALSELPTMPSD